jgi:alkanesulfonate monooxygenase SsuD/methylene tetrahydromethanopterin reductase-like flavin-dependent oxidoreductase (luciferase family)
VLREYVEAMRALWTEDEAAYAGEFVSFGPSWAYPKPAQAHIPLVIGAGGGPQTLAWIARHADGWLTTPTERDVVASAAKLRAQWAEAGRDGAPQIHVLATSKPTPQLIEGWHEAGVTDAVWGLPDRSADEVEAFIGRLATRLGLA